MTESHRLVEIISRTRYLLLDFDGPVCSVFARLPASDVASQLRGLLAENGVKLPHVKDRDDPFEALRLASTAEPALLKEIESALEASEFAAIQGAKPTPFAREVILACHQTGRAVAVVSNNAEPVIEAYLEKESLRRYVTAIAGRLGPDPSLLKPSPHLVLRAMRLLAADPQTCALVGDRPDDMAAAQAAGVQGIGYANRPDKRERLIDAGAAVILTTMEELVATLPKNQR